MQKPDKLYHGSPNSISGMMNPILRKGGSDYLHERAAVFGTERKDLAALFMFSPTSILYSIGFEEDITYICIWGTREEFDSEGKNKEGFIYVLPSQTFQKVSKGYEWQSFETVKPIEVLKFNSALDGMLRCEVQVYFINDDPTFDRIVADKNNRAPILKTLTSENQKLNLNIKSFS